VQGADFKDQFHALSCQVEQASLGVDASKPPVDIWVVSAAGLQHGNRCELCCCELNGSCIGMQFAISGDAVDGPHFFLSVPDTYFDLCWIVGHVNTLGKTEHNLNGVVDDVHFDIWE